MPRSLSPRDPREVRLSSVTDENAPSIATLARTSFRIGCLGFGGPAGQIALMRRIFVEEKKWIGEEEYQHGLGFCMLLPGPEAQQLATYVGWRLQGVWGGVIAGWLFVLPGAAIVFALSWIYAVAGAVPSVAALFDGVKCAVVALVFEALLRIGKRALKTRAALAIAIIAFVVLLWGIPFPLVIITAGLFGAVAMQSPDPETDVSVIDPSATRASHRAGLIWLALWLAPLGAAFLFLGPQHVLSGVGALFSQLACVTFGGAYALLAYLTTEASSHGWLTTAQMIDGLGLAETTPGPLILVNEFVGFLAGWKNGCLALAIAAALMALWCTFAPSFVWIFAAAPHLDRLRHSALARGALDAITAAVLGVIAKLAFFFTAHALFEHQINTKLPFAIAPLDIPDLLSAKLALIVLSIVAGLALIRFKIPLLAVIAGCAIIGFAPNLSGLS